MQDRKTAQNAGSPRRGLAANPRPLVFVTSSYPTVPGDPAGHFVQSEAMAQARRGLRVVVLAPGRGGRAMAHSEGATTGLGEGPGAAAHVETLWLPHGGAFGWPGALPRLRHQPWRVLGAMAFVRCARRALVELAPERVIAHWLFPCAWPIAGASSAPLEIVVHGSDARLLLTAPGPVRRSLVRHLVARGARFRFVSHELRDALLAATVPELAAVSRVEPCAIELQAIPARGAARVRLGVQPARPLLVIVGRLVASKRTSVALGASLLVPDALVVVVGDGPEREPLRRRFPTARFVGQLDRPRCLEWIAAADAVVCASREEGAPTVVREARALGVPVIAAPCGDLARWASDDPELFLVSR